MPADSLVRSPHFWLAPGLLAGIIEHFVGEQNMVIDSNNGIKPGNNGGNNRPTTVAPRESSPQSGAAGNSPRPTSRDSVELSAEAQSMNRLEENLAQLPDVDVERVASLKQAIAEGRFEIDPERIAQNMLNQDDLLG